MVVGPEIFTPAGPETVMPLGLACSCAGAAVGVSDCENRVKGVIARQKMLARVKMNCFIARDLDYFLLKKVCAITVDVSIPP